MGFFDDVIDSVKETVSTGLKKALDLAEPLVHAFADKDARVVPGGGGYVYAQYPDGSIIIKEGPQGLRDLKVKQGTKAWKAITAEIGPWRPSAENAGDDEVVLLDDESTSEVDDEEVVLLDDDADSGEEDPYEQLEIALEDLDRALGSLHDNGSSENHDKLVDRANALYDVYPKIAQRLGEADDVPDDIVRNYLAALKSVTEQLQAADFDDERRAWETNVGERNELWKSLLDVNAPPEITSRFEPIANKAEKHYLYAAANAEWEQLALECKSYLAAVEAGVSVDDIESDEELPEFHSDGASDDEFPAEITVVSTETDEGDTDIGLAAVRLWYALNGGYVAGNSVKEMVDGIIEEANGRSISELTIKGHGASGDQNISDTDAITVGLSGEKRAQLARLKPHFADYAVVTLEGCEVGAGPNGEQLLKELATIWGVRVRAGVPYQRPVLYRGMEGSVTTAVPTENGVEIEQDDSMTNEMWRTLPANPIKPARDDVEALEWVENASNGDLASLSMQDRYLLAKKLISGYTGNDEGEAAVTLFRSAKQADRRELYRLLESHPWEGDFHSGVLTDDDGLVDALSEPQLEELKYLLG